MTTQCFRLFTPIDDPPGASQYLAKWHGYGAGHVLSEMAPVTEPLRPLLAGAAAQLKAIPHGSPVTSGQVQLPMTNTLGVPRHPLSLPLTETAVKALHELSDASSLGVEGRGTVHDTNLRKSREVVVGTAGLHLSKQLMNFNFPAARKQVQDALFQTAADVEYRPYKLVLYAPGDFFVAHADSMSEAHMFGSLALQIPVQPPPSSGDEDVGGALVFYPLTGGELSFDLTSLGPPRTDDSVSVTYAAWLGDVQHEVREVKHHRIVLLYRLFKRGDEWKAVPRNSLSAIRETVDAVFDVSRSCHLPVEKTIEPFVLEPKYECTQEVPSAGEIIIDPITQRGQPTAFRVSCLGILLQHQYPPAGLTPSALKGLDALLHRALSQSYRCHLISVLESREAMYDPRYDTGRPRVSPVIRNVVLADSLERYTSFRYESVSVPVVMAAWINLALGTGCAVGGGHMLGNGDCETEWWYRSTALMVLPPTRWDRCRWFFLALSKGSAPGLQRLYAVQDVFQHMMGFVA